MTVTTRPPAAAAAAAGGDDGAWVVFMSTRNGYRKTRCKHCNTPVTEVVVDDGVVVVDRRDEHGEWRAIHSPGGSWELSRTPGPGVRYGEHRCLEMAAAALGGEIVVEMPRPARAKRRTTTAVEFGTEGPCARHCRPGRRVPNRYGPNAVTLCDDCRA